MLRHCVARIACRLILDTADCCAVAVDVGALALLVGIVYTQPSDVQLNGETRSCITAIECCARHATYRAKLAADPRTLDALAVFTLERNQPMVSLSAQVSLGLLAWDVDTRVALSRSSSVVCSLVSVAVEHARGHYIPLEAVAIARALFCLVLVPTHSCNWLQVVKLGVLTALISLETRRGQETLHFEDIDDDDDSSMCANFELSTVVMCALRVIAERGADSSEISLRLRNEGAIDIVTSVASPKRATLMKKPDRRQGISFWRYSAFIRSYAVLYAFSRNHEVLRQKIDGAVVAAIHTVTSGLVRCEDTSDLLRGWSVATLALLLVDPVQRNRIATEFNMLVELIQIARVELQRRKPIGCHANIESFMDGESPRLLVSPPATSVGVDGNHISLPSGASPRSSADELTSNTQRKGIASEVSAEGLSVNMKPTHAFCDETVLTSRGLPPRDGSLSSGQALPTSLIQEMLPITSEKRETDSNSAGDGRKKFCKLIDEKDDLLEDPTLAVRRGTAEKNIVWCFFQLSKVEKKKTREVLQDATELIAQLSRRRIVKEKIWLVAATSEAHRLLARRQYESNLITKSGTLSLLVRHSFRGGSDENESAMNASLKMLEDFDRLASALQPTGDHVCHHAHSPTQTDTNTAYGVLTSKLDLYDVPNESNDFFLSDCGGRGPKVQELALAERMEQPQNGNGMTDLESNLSDDDGDAFRVEYDSVKDDKLSQGRTMDQHNLRKYPTELTNHNKECNKMVSPWFTKMGVPAKLLEASKFDEHALLDNSFEENSTEGSSESDSSASDNTTDSESDYADFRFVERSTAKRQAISSEKIIIEDNWHPHHYEKFPDKISFLTDRLQQIFFLKHLTRKETRLITNAMRPMSILAGECLVTERHYSDTFYIITNGSCFVSTEERGKISDIPGIDPDHPDRPPRLHVGELALLYGQVSPVSVTAATDLEVLSLERRIFKSILENSASKQRTLYTEFIDKVPLFKDMSIHQKNVICDALKPIDFNAGDIIVREGEDGDDFFIIEEGTVECLKIVRGVQKRVCPPLGLSSFFGELALLRNAPRSATVKALEAVCVLRIDRDTFDRTIGQIEAVHKDYGDEAPSPNEKMKLSCSLNGRKHNRKKRRSKVTLVDGTESDSSDDEADYADFKYVKPNCSPVKRAAVTADRVLVENDWSPPYYDKTREQESFLTETLGRLFFMSQLTRKERSLLVNAMYFKTLSPGVQFITQGDKGDLFYIVEGGNCVVTIDGVGKVMDIPDYAGTEYSRAPARRHIGELALLYERPRGASVTTLNEVTAWCLDRTTFKAILQNTASKQRLLYAGFISKVPLFKNLDTVTKNIICDALKPQDYDAGDEIIIEGDDGDEFFIIETGTVECLKTVEGQQVRVCPPLGPPTYFGELALLRNAPRAATVKAVEDVSVLCIDRGTFDRIVGRIDGVEKNYGDDGKQNLASHYKRKSSADLQASEGNHVSLYRGNKLAHCMPISKSRGRRVSYLHGMRGARDRRLSSLTDRRQSIASAGLNPKVHASLKGAGPAQSRSRTYVG